MENKKATKKLLKQYRKCLLYAEFETRHDDCLRIKNNISILKKNKNINIIKYDRLDLVRLGFDVITIDEIELYRDTGKLPGYSLNIYTSELSYLLESGVFDIEDIKLLCSPHNQLSFSELKQSCITLASINRLEKEKENKYIRFLDFISSSEFNVERECILNNSKGLDNTYNSLWNGNLHNHTLYSDGVNSIREIVDFLLEKGKKYVGISDHSNHMKKCDIERQHNEIDELNKELDNSFKIFKGIECDILSTGNLALPENLLSSFDYVIASVHDDYYQPKSVATERLIKAIENPFTKILGHPLSRVYNTCPGLDVDIYKVIDACARNNTIIEINGSPEKLDLPLKYIDYALSKGIIFSFDCDSHSNKDFVNINNAIFMGIDKNIHEGKYINSFSSDKIIKFFQNSI